MTKGIQIRRGSTTDHNSFTGRDGEITVDTSKKVVVVHDNTVAGGYPLVGERGYQVVEGKTFIAGAATSTGTASQPLQVVGGAYVSGNLGVGATNPASKLHVVGDVRTDNQFLGKGTDSVSEPSYSWLGDSNTGMYSPSAGNLAFSADGVEELRINTSGVGIGITNPSSSLQVGVGVTIDANSGIISATSLRPAGGTSTVAPVTFTPGSLLTNQSIGSIEYAGVGTGGVFYATHANFVRGLIPTTTQYVNNTSLLLNSSITTAQNWLVGFVLAGSTTYEFEGTFNIVTTGTTSHNEQLLFGGTATLSRIGYSATRTSTATIAGTASTTNAIWAPAATAQIMTGLLNTGQTANYLIKGIVEINGGGTFIPQFLFGNNAPGGTSTISAGAWFKLNPLGSHAANISVGTTV
jgi:hypothetical protein